MSLKNLPSVEKVTQSLEGSLQLPKALITQFVRSNIQEWRMKLLNGDTVEKEDIIADIQEKLKSFSLSKLQPVTNATGVLIHTNLGRSPLGERSSKALMRIASGYCNLEFNLEDGQRGKRAGYIETALATLLGAESAIAVNNCAAALVLALRYFTKGEKKEVIVSRGELVEIGGGFRIPEIMETSGAILVEVGATNKTHLSDYEKAVTPNTALILKVHRSNFYLEGFTDEPSIIELRDLAKKHSIPLMQDIGSGAVMHTDELAPIDHEPTPQKSITDGIEVVCFSGDKLLGGPQSGILAGHAEHIKGIKTEPFFRAVRCDKLILTALQECIDCYLEGLSSKDTSNIPMLEFMRKSPEEIQQRSEKVIALIGEVNAEIQIIPSIGRTGGGTMPKAEIPSYAIQVKPTSTSLNKFAKVLRLEHQIVGYTTDNSYCFDLRSVFPDQDMTLAKAIKDTLS